MADGFDIHVSADLARRIAEEAEASGQTPEAVALSILEEAFEPLGDTADLDWAEDVRRAEKYDREGGGHTVAEVFDELEAEIKARMAKRD
eukprot:gene17121-16943_t